MLLSVYWSDGRMLYDSTGIYTPCDLRAGAIAWQPTLSVYASICWAEL